MGLTIYYKLQAPAAMTVRAVRGWLDRTRVWAEKIGCADVGEIKEVGPEFRSGWQSVLGPGIWGPETPQCDVAPKRGYIVEIWPGEGCDSAYLGVCQYPRLAYNWHGKLFRPDFARCWSFRSSCKTQFASEFGWDHFLRCHKQVLSLLKFWQHLGATVEVDDEGHYWGTHSYEYLRSLLGSYNRLLAVCAGAMKDAAEVTGKGLRVDSPIFDRPDFERLEHEGWQEIKADPAAYLTGLKREPRQGRRAANH